MEWILRFLAEAYAIFALSAPFLLLGFVLAGLTHVLLPTGRAEKWLGQHRGWRGIVGAALIGVPLPLCSCSVIPVASALRKQGAGRGATASFLISTPETGMDSIAVTFALLDPIITVFRPAAALVTAVVGGLLVDLFAGKPGPDETWPQKPRPRHLPQDETWPQKPRPRHPAHAAGTRTTTWAGWPTLPTDQCADGGEETGPWHARAFRFGFGEIPRDVFWSLVAGLLLSGAIAALLPDDFFTRHVGNEAVAVVLMLVVGMPLYVCASASTPIAAAMILKGLSPGAALVFLLAGPATNLTTMLAVRRQLGWRALGAYLLSIAVMSVVMGLALNAVYHVFLGGQWTMNMGKAGEEVLPAWLTVGSVIVLAATLAAAAGQKVSGRLRRTQKDR